MKLKPTDTINLEGTEIKVADMPEHIKNLVSVYDEIKRDFEEAKIEVVKCQTSLKQLTTELAAAVKQHLDSLPKEEVGVDEEDD